MKDLTGLILYLALLSLILIPLIILIGIGSTIVFPLLLLSAALELLRRQRHWWTQREHRNDIRDFVENHRDH